MAPQNRWRIDITPLRESADFRRLFASGLVTYLGSMITYVAIPFQIATITGSYVAVGLIGLAELVPLIFFGLYGGSLADSVDRRKMILATEIAAAVAVTLLTVNALLPNPHVWPIYVIAMVLASVDGLQRPSMEAIVPRIVRHDLLSAAAALTALRWQVGMIVGPAIGGLLLAAGGVRFAYAIDALSFVVSVGILRRLSRSAGRPIAAASAGLAHVLDGLRYAWRRKDLLGTYAIDLIAMTFAFPYVLFPFLAEELDAVWALGLLYSAGAVGSMVVSLTSGWTKSIHRYGRAIAFAAMGWGAAIALVGLTDSLVVVLVLLAIAGAADMVSGIFRSTMWNQTIPDEMRGRMAGIEVLSYSIGPLLGQVRSSTAASLTSLRASFVSGGLLCVVGVALATISLPSLWKFDVRTDEVARQRRDAGSES